MRAGGGRRSTARAVVGLVGVAVALGSPGAAHAATADDAPAAALELTVTTPDESYVPGEPVPLTAAVRNLTGAPCSLAAHPDAALHVEAMTRDGEPVSPDLTRALYDPGLPESVREGLQAVDPGESVEVTRTLSVMEADTERLLLTDVEPLPDGDALLALWPVDGPADYEVTLR